MLRKDIFADYPKSSCEITGCARGGRVRTRTRRQRTGSKAAFSNRNSAKVYMRRTAPIMRSGTSPMSKTGIEKSVRALWVVGIGVWCPTAVSYTHLRLSRLSRRWSLSYYGLRWCSWLPPGLCHFLGEGLQPAHFCLLYTSRCV